MKYLVAICWLAACLVLANASYGAQAGAEARSVLQNAISTILSDISSPEFANPETRKQVVNRIEHSVRSVFDFSEFSSRTVGPRWKTFSAAQKDSFANAFADLLFATYLNKITGYNGENVSYTGETVSKDGSRVEIKTSLAMSDGRKIPVAYRMLPKNGAWVVYDVIIENISLVKNYRTQFQDILNTASPEQLIEKIESRAKEVAAQGTVNGK